MVFHVIGATCGSDQQIGPHECHSRLSLRQRAVSGFTGAKTPPRIIARGVPRNCSCLSTPRHPRTLCLGFRDGILLRGMRSVPEMPRTGLCRTSTVLLTAGRRRGACSITSCFRGLCGSARGPEVPPGEDGSSLESPGTHSCSRTTLKQRKKGRMNLRSDAFGESPVETALGQQLWGRRVNWGPLNYNHQRSSASLSQLWTSRPGTLPGSSWAVY